MRDYYKKKMPNYEAGMTIFIKTKQTKKLVQVDGRKFNVSLVYQLNNYVPRICVL